MAVVAVPSREDIADELVRRLEMPRSGVPDSLTGSLEIDWNAPDHELYIKLRVATLCVVDEPASADL